MADLSCAPKVALPNQSLEILQLSECKVHNENLLI